MRRLVPHVLDVLGFVMVVDLVAMMMLTVVDVVGRYIFNEPIPGTSEIIEFMLAILVFGTLPLATVRCEHIVIDIMDFAIKGRRKRVQQIAVHFTSAALLAFIGWRLWVRAGELSTYGDGTPFLRIPLAPLGFAMSIMAWMTAALTVVLFLGALRGDADPFRSGASAPPSA